MSILDILTPYLTYLKIGAGVVVIAGVAGLYWWGHEKSVALEAATVEQGVLQKTIADDLVVVSAYRLANASWEAALNKLQIFAQHQSDVAVMANAEKEMLDARVLNLTMRLQANPVATASAVSGDLAHTLCLLNDATRGGTGNGCTAPAPGALNAPAAGAASTEPVRGAVNHN